MARTKSIDDDLLLDRLTDAFRLYGYEGASLARISEATGLQRASLYHRFPGGKIAMAEAVLDRAAERVLGEVTAPLRESGTPKERLAKMAQEIDAFYRGGEMPCLLDSMSFAGAEASLSKRVEASVGAWIDAIAQVFEEAGFSEKSAHGRAVEVMIRIQGSLVVARATKNRGPFLETLKTLPESVDDVP